jgi:hypothetical protein
MKGFCPASVLRAAIGAVRNEEFRDRTSKRGGGHVEGRVAGVKVVGDLAEKKLDAFLRVAPTSDEAVASI